MEECSFFSWILHPPSRRARSQQPLISVASKLRHFFVQQSFISVITRDWMMKSHFLTRQLLKYFFTRSDFHSLACYKINNFAGQRLKLRYHFLKSARLLIKKDQTRSSRISCSDRKEIFSFHMKRKRMLVSVLWRKQNANCPLNYFAHISTKLWKKVIAKLIWFVDHRKCEEADCNPYESI